PVKTLQTGEILVACRYISPGYWKNPEATEEIFDQDEELGRIYWTGDLGRLLMDGGIEFLGRGDSQVKIRGFRVEVGEIETWLFQHKKVKEAVVLAKEDDRGDAYLCSYVVPHKLDTGEEDVLTISEIREFLSKELPDYMVPSYLVQLKEMPLTQSNKIDRKKLPEPEHVRPQLGVSYVAPAGGLEKEITGVWKEALKLDKVGINDNFFDLGGTSFDILKVSDGLHEMLGKEIPIVNLFRYPTISSFIDYLESEEKEKPGGAVKMKTVAKPHATSSDIAVIGMAGRFPGARDIAGFWENLKAGVECISFFTTRELAERGVERELLQDPAYVKAKGIMEGIEYFDAFFFNYSPVEARMMDPQLRVMHEVCWEALEDAGYNAEVYEGSIGLYAGNAPNQYWSALTYINRKEDIDTAFLNSNYSTKVSYKLNLTGPSYIVQTACSTSLVAIHLACVGLHLGECDMALAGGVSISLPDKEGYLYREGMILSPDGHCRAFDAEAGGTVFGNGAGIVVLKRLEDAVADGDTISAVIKGSATNNDGSRKVGVTAPSVDGQAEVIRAAHEIAQVEPESITYIEAHGTGTVLGDPIEIEALKLAFGADKKGYCHIGSVKPNVGHLNAASGVTGFIKAVLSLKHRLLPPSLHFETPNPKIDFENSPFSVVKELTEWKSDSSAAGRDAAPLRAGVSSFGIGGTNAHVVLEEWDDMSRSAEDTAEFGEKKGDRQKNYVSNRSDMSYSSHPDPRLLVLSARTQVALHEMSENFARHLKENPGIDLADAAYTLQLGRKGFMYRKMLVCSNKEEIDNLLSAPVFQAREGKKAVMFMFPGQGAQYVDMARELYESEPGFRAEMDRCFEILKESGTDIKAILYPEQQEQSSADHASSPASSDKPDKPDKADKSNKSYMSDSDTINNTEIAQPLIFTVQYALAKQLMSWGIEPYALIGHSIGEYAAACLSGVFSLQDALGLVVLRGKLMQSRPSGSMLSVPLPAEEVSPMLNKKISLAAVNSPVHCVVSGEHEDIDAFAGQLKEAGHEGRKLHTSHAFHSRMMEPILEEFQQAVSRVTLNKPGIPYISNVSGQWISVEEAQDPAYWARHIRSAVRFNDGFVELLKSENPIFVEIGPGRTLSAFVRQHQDKQEGIKVLHLVKHPKEKESDSRFLLSKLGQLWLYGVNIDWKLFYAAEKRRRIPLPTYPFQRQRYWLEGNPYQIGAEQSIMPSKKKETGGRKADMSEWFYVPAWEQALLAQQQAEEGGQPVTGLFFGDDSFLSSRLSARLQQDNLVLATVRAGKGFAALKDNEYTIDPGSEEDYLKLLESVDLPEELPLRIVHMWNAVPSGQEFETGAANRGFDIFDKAQERGFYSLLNLGRAIGRLNMKQPVEILVITSEVHSVSGEEELSPAKTTVLGAVQVVSREYPQVQCRTIDIESAAISEADESLVENLLSEIQSGVPDMHTAYRGGQRWKRTFQAEWIGPANREAVIKEKGVYLVTGGLGGIGLVLAEFLAESYKARLILTDFSPFPAREEWEERLQSGGETDPICHKIEQVRQLESYGAEVAVYSADAADMEQMETVVRRAEEKFGPVNGVIHAAGIAGGGLIQIRAKELSEKVFAPKVKGTIVLDAIFGDRQLDFLMLCSSISSVLAPVGQAAYAAANAYLNAYAQRRTLAGKGFTSAISWDNWSQVGMAVDATARLSGQEKKRISNIEQGISNIEGMEKGPSLAPRAAGPPRRRRQEIDYPLFSGHETEGNGRQVFFSHLDVKQHWVLDEHRIGGKAVLPGAAYLELARAAFETHAAGETFELRDVYFLSPLMVDEAEGKEVLTLLEESGEGYDFSIVSRREAGKEEWNEHARGKAVVLRKPESKPKAKGKSKTKSKIEVKTHDLDALKAECEETVTYDPAAYNGESGAMLFGPRWNNVRQVDYGRNRCLGYLELPAEFAAEVDHYKLHPALLDTATTLLRGRLSEEEKGSFLPFSYKRITIRGAVPAGVYCYVRGADGDGAAKGTRSYQVALMDEKGREIVAIEDFTLKQVKLDAPKNRQLAALSSESLTLPEQGENYYLGISAAGDFSNLEYREKPRRSPEAGEIEIFVKAAGLNFKEVLRVLGAVGPVAPEQEFGLECSGEVAALGKGVGNFKVGDEVVVFGTSCFSSYTTVPAASAVRKPERLDFAEAASIPVAFMTAYHALVKLARLKQGEKVLIHSAAGGVGLAAVEIARHLGAEIFATAGNKEKRAYLGSLGIEHVFSSRDLDFADAILKRTGDRGVDVVLNSLAGDFIGKSMSVLAPFGRFVEIGIRDIMNDTPLGLRHFLKGLSYFAFQLSFELPGIEKTWAEIMHHFEIGNFEPPPTAVFPRSGTARAFEYMTKGAHIGKILVSRSAAAPSLPDLSAGARGEAAADDASQPSLQEGISSAEGVEIFRRIIAGEEHPHVVVSTNDLFQRIERSGIEPQLTGGAEPAAATSPGDLISRPELSTAYAAPRTTTEKKLAAIWQDLLGIDKIGIEDNFFDLGGTSLNLVQLGARLNEILNLDSPATVMFRYPTVKSFLEYLEQKDSPGKEAALDRDIDESMDVLDETMGLMDSFLKNE
ncbi:MAG: SDR family NAD(P)-dependent oxidoreductase, partial [Candidatus Aminicenantes bacterium]|nr:SDR family NAD(P)-dependent oxidoreductase [Candidatus Aminicenantes bacterium]